jgi:enoyl-CoA hydratase/carnithine racemase
MSSNHLLVQKKDKIVTLVLNRPEVLNAMSAEMIQQLHDAFINVAKDENTRVVILKGAGDHFSSGADISLFKCDEARRTNRGNNS